MSAADGENLAAALPGAAREIEEFVSAAGWDQPTQVFALVPTEQLLVAEPNLADEVDVNSPLTPIAQESLPAEDLAEALSRIEWPEQVAGCALVQEIVVLPPEAEASLPTEDEQARNAAAEHPDRQEARLVAAVLRAGHETCVLRLRASGEEGEAGERVQDPTLAPNLLRALHETFAA
ncbi:PPA1309 family protein [Saccharopolyspora gloriosae]|uniref:PPA1309 family protein n=1 Tax=Saccharopolyspora gloriosae TaxID=455344 RepID=UPI001FB5B7E5|nr:PPA1309 family protein [Saccharopolyspora gloriosae]